MEKKKAREQSNTVPIFLSTDLVVGLDSWYSLEKYLKRQNFSFFCSEGTKFKSLSLVSLLPIPIVVDLDFIWIILSATKSYTRSFIEISLHYQNHKNSYLCTMVVDQMY